MRVIYSQGTNLGGKGQGYLAWGTCRGLADHEALLRILCFSHAVEDFEPGMIRHVAPAGRYVERLALLPGRLVPSLRFASFRWKDDLFDVLASRRLEDADILFGWSHHCLRTIRAAKKRGMLTAVESATSHVVTQRDILFEECDRWNVPRATQTHPGFIEKSLAEYEEADRIVVTSTFSRDSMLHHGLPASKIILAPYGYDDTRYYAGEPPAADPFRVVSVGMIGLRKGTLYLLEAWRRLALKRAELLLCGKVDPEVQHLLAPYRKDASIRFLGYVDPAPLLRSAHLSVLPTLEDGFATVVSESMACGVPSVVTENTGAKDVVQEGVDGFVVPIRDVEALQERILSVYEDRSLQARLAAAAARNIRAWDWSRRGRILAGAFRKTLAG